MIATNAAGCTVTYDAGALWVQASWRIRESGFAAHRAGESWARWAPAPGSNLGSGIGLFERRPAVTISRGRANGPERGAPRRRSGRNEQERAMKKPGASTPDSFESVACSTFSCVEVRRSSVFV